MPKIDHKLHGQYNFLNIKWKTVSIIAEQLLSKWISKHIGEIRGKTVSITAVLYDVGNFKHLIRIFKSIKNTQLLNICFFNHFFILGFPIYWFPYILRTLLH